MPSNKAASFQRKLAALLAEATPESLLVSLRLAIARVECCLRRKSMVFVKHGGLGKEFPGTTTPPTPIIWSEQKLRSELQTRGVWVSSLPGNVECWYPKVLADVQAHKYTFEAFADEFASQQPFDFGKTIKRLHEPAPCYCGGWLEGYME
jgi:hypothetical protein